MRNDMVPCEDLQCPDRRCTPRRHSGKCRAGRKISVVAQDFVTRGDSAQWRNTTGQVLAVHEDIGYDVIVFDAPHPARTTQPRQHFVRDHQPVVLVADVANTT